MRSHGQFNKGIDARRSDTGLRRAEPGRPGRLGVRPLAARVLTAVLLAAFAALLALSAQAQTTAITLVSNTGEIVGAGSSNFGAQSFETGSNADGYTVSEVDIHLGTAANKSTTVKIREDDGSDEPGALVATPNNPATLTNSGLNTFTAPADTTLAADTTYWISVNEGSSNRASFITTSGNGQTGEPGWSIGNQRLWRSSEGEGWATSHDLSFLIAIKGTAPTDVKLVLSTSTLTVGEAGSGTFTVKLGTQPSANVTVSVSSDDTGAATASPASRIFTTTNWNTTKTVTVSGVNDLDTNVESVTVSLAASGGDYAGKTASVSVRVTDDDIRVPYDLDLGEKALPEEEIYVWIPPPFAEEIYVVAEGDRWSPSGVWGDPVKDMIWVVDPIHFGIHALKLSALKGGLIERHIAADTSAFDYRFNYNCHFKRT